MMRGLTGTVVWSSVAAAIGVGLFFVKHEVKEQEARLADLNLEIQRNQEAIHVLKAEWSYLNDPARLRRLSEKYLDMKPMAPAQVATLDSLPRDGGPVYAADPAPVSVPAPVAVARTARPAKAPAPAAVAKVEPAKPAAAAVKVAKAVPPSQPAAAAAAPAGRRTIVIQSPALAASEMVTSGEAR